MNTRREPHVWWRSVKKGAVDSTRCVARCYFFPSHELAAYIALRYYPFPIETVPPRVGRIYVSFVLSLAGQWRKSFASSITECTIRRIFEEEIHHWNMVYDGEMYYFVNRNVERILMKYQKLKKIFDVKIEIYYIDVENFRFCKD